MLIPNKRQERELKSLVSTIHQQLETSRMVSKHRIHQQRSTPKAEKQRLSIFAHLVFENILIYANLTFLDCINKWPHPTMKKKLQNIYLSAKTAKIIRRSSRKQDPPPHQKYL